MKSTYVRPTIHIEQFMTNQFIANCNFTLSTDKTDAMSCTNPWHTVNHSSYDCWQDSDSYYDYHNHDHDHTIAGRVTNVFSAGAHGCVTLIQSGSEYTASSNNYFPNDGATVYGFTAGTDTSLAQEKKYTFSSEGWYDSSAGIRYHIQNSLGEWINDCFGSFINKTTTSSTFYPFS